MPRNVRLIFSERITTRQELSMDENIAMVIFGHKTEVIHHLTSDYNIVRQHLGKYLFLFKEQDCVIIVFYLYLGISICVFHN